MEPISKLKSILNGWKNYTRKEPEIEKMAKERAEKCAHCQHAVYGTYEKLMRDYSLKKVQGMKCDKCGCPLSTKLRSKIENCPIGLW
jgi:hypothetical protein